MTRSQHYRLRATEAVRNGDGHWASYYQHVANAVALVEPPERHLGHNRWRVSLDRRVARSATVLRVAYRAAEALRRHLAARAARRAAYADYCRFIRHES